MSRIYTNDGVYLAKALKDHLNSWHGKPALINLEDFGGEVPSMMLQQLSGAYKKRAYIDGSYLGSYPFSVYIRVDGADTASRLDATGALYGLFEWLTQKDENGEYVNLPTIDDSNTATAIDMTSLPSIAARYDDGTEDYQAIFELQYNVRRKIR